MSFLPACMGSFPTWVDCHCACRLSHGPSSLTLKKKKRRRRKKRKTVQVVPLPRLHIACFNYFLRATLCKALFHISRAPIFTMHYICRKNLQWNRKALNRFSHLAKRNVFWAEENRLSTTLPKQVLKGSVTTLPWRIVIKRAITNNLLRTLLSKCFLRWTFYPSGKER